MTRRRIVAFCIIALLVASLVVGHVPSDWSTFDHRTFCVTSIVAGDCLAIDTGKGHAEIVKLMGIDPIDSSEAVWLKDHLAGRRITLLLSLPQSRDDQGRLRAFAFVDNQDISVELAKEGLAYADRREKTQMDGLIDSAEGDARKKKRGAWATLTFEQMPAWRQAWVKSLASSFH